MFYRHLCADDESLIAFEINTHKTRKRQNFQWELLETYENIRKILKKRIKYLKRKL